MTKGPNIIDKVADNNQRTGNWTEIRTYSNNNILADPNGYFNECSDVSSALNSLFLNIESILNGSGSVTKSLPDYFDGKIESLNFITQITHQLELKRDMIYL